MTSEPFLPNLRQVAMNSSWRSFSTRTLNPPSFMPAIVPYGYTFVYPFLEPGNSLILGLRRAKLVPNFLLILAKSFALKAGALRLPNGTNRIPVGNSMGLSFSSDFLNIVGRLRKAISTIYL